MESQRVLEETCSVYGINNNINLSSTLINNHDGQSFDFGELEQAIVLQGLGAMNKLDHYEPKQSFLSGKPAATLEMFPSWPIKYQQTSRGVSLRKREEMLRGSGNYNNSNEEKEMEILGKDEEDEEESEMSNCSAPQQQQQQHEHNYNTSCFNIINNIQPHQVLMVSTDVSTTALSSQHQYSLQQKRKGCGSISTSQKQLDAKTLRRLAQNREAARKSRLRKKAYVQQLESSRIKLTQLEQDFQRARSQGIGGGNGNGNVNHGSGALWFDMEYVRWLEEEHRHTMELRGGLEAHLSDTELKVRVDACIYHYDQFFRLKSEAAKFDIFHLITGMWMSPAERCFLWIGGFRPSDLIKMLMSQLDPITEQQVMEIYKLQNSSQQAEDALSQGLDQLHQSLIDTVAGSPIVDGGINHMVLAMDKLSSLHGFLHQGY
ncbi:transcription factor TGA9 isoform X2 [Cucumis sativus]|uniref:transcription factor TGA9 isoform X2 n=1 Tax=Cucumis sativus TaxID=3659 RepID=UPI0012F4AFD7|nr:transcription factor TGA9 isoform X2 [Cucumis sativus]